MPESLEVVDDTEVNYPPAIVAADPLTTTKTTLITSEGAHQREFNLTIEDMNPSDKLYIRFFVDYAQSPGEPIAASEVPPTESPTAGDFKRASGPIVIKCRSMLDASGVPASGSHTLTAIIADRPFINDFPATPPVFRHLPPDARQTEVTWEVECPP